MSNLADLVNALPAVAFQTDRSFSVTFISAYWTELTGQRVEDACGAGWTQHLDAESLSTAYSELQRALLRDELVRCVVRCRTKVGDWCWLRVVARPRLLDEQPVGIAGMAVVVPAAEAIDEGTRVRLEAMEGHEARAEALLSASPDLLFHVGAAGNFIGFRAADPQTLFVKPEQFLGHTLEDVMPELVARRSREAMERARASGVVQLFVYELPVGGNLRAFEARVVPMKREDTLFVVRDVTEARRNEAELVVAREEALERSRLKTQFLANVSHEIRTPLNGILGVTQLLKQHSLPAEFGEYVDVLQSGGESLLAIVNDVLDLSKIEANRLELEPRVFALDQVISEAARIFLAVAQRKKLELVVDIAPGAQGPVRGDATRVRQIVNNLVGNALKFTDAGSVRVSVSRAQERVKISVQDTGPGIALEHQARIFEPFEQADVGVQRRFGGTGLGLAITRRLARLMGGDVSVHSALGQGALFELEVPLPEVVIHHPPQQASRVTPPPRMLRVLLAEDDPINAAMTAALLSKLGHTVRVVNNGLDCVEVVKAGELDLVLMDVQMPGLDGLEATRVIRDAERGTAAHLPIVALTANAMKGDDLRCLSAGMDAYLPKPVTVTALKDLLLWFGSKEP